MTGNYCNVTIPTLRHFEEEVSLRFSRVSRLCSLFEQDGSPDRNADSENRVRVQEEERQASLFLLRPSAINRKLRSAESGLRALQICACSATALRRR